MNKPRLLTGDRPTGKLHLGHYVGTLQNRVRLQQDYESYFIVADLHMLTTRNAPAEIARIDQRAREMVLDALAAGIEPDRVTFYLQSAVPEIHEVAGLLQSLVTVSRLQRIPTLKEMARAAGVEMSLALLAYPVLQAADILCVRAEAVPVGKDNYSYVEVTREVARHFNARYGEVFPIPEIIAGETPTLVGTDGKAKMSKSLNNAVFLSDAADEVRRKVRGMYTDPARVRADIPGTVAGNPVFQYLDAFGRDPIAISALKKRYEAGTVSDVEVKETLTDALNAFLAPMRERRARFDQPGLIDELLVRGTARVRTETQATVREVRKAMGLSGAWNRIRRRAERRASATGSA